MLSYLELCRSAEQLPEATRPLALEVIILSERNLRLTWQHGCVW